MSRPLPLLWLAPLLPALAFAGAPFHAEVTGTGSVNVDVGGVRCLDGLQVVLPAPGWRGAAGPAKCARETLGPGHVRVTGLMSDGEPCARFAVDCQTSETGADLAWELSFTRDYPTETVRLNGMLPCASSAGKGAWFVRRPDSLKWALLPAGLGEPGGDFGDWGFDWFGWVLPGDRGVRFRAQSGLRDMYLQDGRHWGGDYFQICWTLAGKGTVRKGAVLRCAIRIELLAASDLLTDAKRLGLTLLAVAGSLEPAAAGGGVEGRIEIRNVKPGAQSLDVAWRMQDDVGVLLGRGKQRVEAPSLGSAQVSVAARGSASGDYRLRAEVRPRAGGPVEVVSKRLVVPLWGPRSVVSLDGQWELCPAGSQDAAPPANAAWKPVTVPGRIDGAEHNRYWYRRTFELPKAMAGKRLKLQFRAVNHEARVYVNGRPAGRHLGGNLPFEFDVSELARAGANELLVAVTNWTAACTKPPERFQVGPFEHPGWKIPPGSIIAPIGGDFQMTGIWQSVSLLACHLVHIQDVFVQTSVRRHTIQSTVTVRNEGDGPCTVEMTSEIADCDGQAKRLLPATFTLPAGERREVVVSAPWANPRLWSLDDPHLYRLATQLMVNGILVDTVSTRFGFREVWTDGPRFVLNGVPMKLFATSGWSMDSWGTARAHVARMKAAGTRALRLHTQPWQEHILDAADEVGMLIVDEAAVYCYAPSYAPGDKRFWENYADHVRGLARRDRNHPSLAIYSLENEILSCGGRPAEWEAPLGRLADIVREVDPTRLVTCESDLDPAGKMDLIGMHYPREYWSGYTLYPDKCWWLDQEITYLGRPWRWKCDKPLYMGEFDGGFPAWYPQYQAFWLGDEAYVGRGRFSAASANSRARREMITMEVQAYRAGGVTGLNPWFDPDEVDVFGPKPLRRLRARASISMIRLGGQPRCWGSLGSARRS